MVENQPVVIALPGLVEDRAAGRSIVVHKPIEGDVRLPRALEGGVEECLASLAACLVDDVGHKIEGARADITSESDLDASQDGDHV